MGIKRARIDLFSVHKKAGYLPLHKEHIISKIMSTNVVDCYKQTEHLLVSPVEANYLLLLSQLTRSLRKHCDL